MRRLRGGKHGGTPGLTDLAGYGDRPYEPRQRSTTTPLDFVPQPGPRLFHASRIEGDSRPAQNPFCVVDMRPAQPEDEPAAPLIRPEFQRVSRLREPHARSHRDDGAHPTPPWKRLGAPQHSEAGDVNRRISFEEQGHFRGNRLESQGHTSRRQGAGSTPPLGPGGNPGSRPAYRL
jgi:hypothetical protein